MKKLSKTVLGIIIGILIAFTIDVAAEAVISSGAVSYSNTTVSAALDELFSAVDINNKIGTTDISTIGDGTITGALSTQQSNITDLQGEILYDANNIFAKKYGNMIIVQCSNAEHATVFTQLQKLLSQFPPIRPFCNNISFELSGYKEYLGFIGGSNSSSLYMTVFSKYPVATTSDTIVLTPSVSILFSVYGTIIWHIA